MRKCAANLKKNISAGSTIKDLIFNSFKEIKPDIKQLLDDDIKENKDGFTQVTNQSVSGSVSNKLLNLEKEHYELQQYSRRNIVEVLGLPDMFTGDLLTEKVVELCIDVGVMVEVKDIEVYHRQFQKQIYNQLPKRTFVRFVRRQFDDFRSKQNISSRLDFNKLGFPRGTQIYFNANFCRYY